MLTEGPSLFVQTEGDSAFSVLKFFILKTWCYCIVKESFFCSMKIQLEIVFCSVWCKIFKRPPLLL